MWEEVDLGMYPVTNITSEAFLKSNPTFAGVIIDEDEHT